MEWYIYRHVFLGLGNVDFGSSSAHGLENMSLSCQMGGLPNLDDDKPLSKMVDFGNQPIKNGGTSHFRLPRLI